MANESQKPRPAVTFTHLHQPSVPSTNVWALSWLKEHGLDGPMLFTADGQTAGQGQRHKTWSTHHGEDLSMSLALPVQSGWTPPVFNMAVALSIRASLERLRPPHADEAEVQIKWPNDILITQEGSSRKCAGILVENVWRGASWSATVVGVGVNVNSERLTSPFHATSLHDAWGITLQPQMWANSWPETSWNNLPTPCLQLLVCAGSKGTCLGWVQSVSSTWETERERVSCPTWTNMGARNSPGPNAAKMNGFNPAT